MLHAIETDKGACAAQACLAVHSNGARLLLGSRQELRHNIVRWCSTISEEQVEMLDALLSEFALLILGLVKSHHERDAQSLPNWHVILRRKRAISICDVERARERDEFAGYNPIEITTLDLFEVLVLLYVEVVVVVPAEGDTVLEPLEAVKICAAIGAVSHCRVSVRNELVVVGLENSPCFLS